MRRLLHYVQTPLNFGNIWKSRCDWLFYWIVATGNIIFLCWEIVKGSDGSTHLTRGVQIRKKQKGRRTEEEVNWTCFSFCVCAWCFTSILRCLHCAEQLSVWLKALCQLQCSSARAMWAIYHFYNSFSPQTLHCGAGYNLATAMSLSSWWQVNVHFHPYIRPTSSVFDLWEVSLQGIDVAVHF